MRVNRADDKVANVDGAKRTAADDLLHYVAKREEMIRYPECLARDWQIGSGPTEALCKSTPARRKGSGMHWDADNAETVMAWICLKQRGPCRVFLLPPWDDVDTPND